MNQSERYALRKKHTPFIDIDFGECCSWCCAGDEYPSIPYPCDTIKVLDALDRVAKLAQRFMDSGITSVCESALEIGEMIMWEIEQ